MSVSFSSFYSFTLVNERDRRRVVRVHLARVRRAETRALAIQVFKGHYKSDKPDGVIPSGEAEVRHYAMETSISGGIVATICFSLSARPLPITTDRRRGRRLFAGKLPWKIPGPGYSHV